MLEQMLSTIGYMRVIDKEQYYISLIRYFAWRNVFYHNLFSFSFIIDNFIESSSD